MQFQFPTYLWALLAIILPIIIHLFYFKRFKKVYFSSLWMLKEVKEETSMRNKLRDLLTLLMRILAIAMLVLAFVQPIWKNDGDKLDIGKKSISIYIDNSFSMQAKKDEVVLLDYAKQKAREIINAYSSVDEFNILSNELIPNELRFFNKDQALLALEQISISPSRRSLSIVKHKQDELLKSRTTSRRTYIISDFQKNITDLEENSDSTIQSFLIPVQSIKYDNVSIDSVWLIAPIPVVNESNNLLIRIVNNGNQEIQGLRLNMEHDGKNRPIATYDIEANASIVDTIKIVVNNPGWQELTFDISDYPVTFDDEYNVSFEVKNKVEVLNIYNTEPTEQLENVYAGATNVSYSSVSFRSIDYGLINENELIILNNLETISSGLLNVIVKYVEGGGNLFIAPASQINFDSYNKLMNALKIDRFSRLQKENKETQFVNTNEFIFNNVFLRKDKNIKMPTTSLSYEFVNSSVNSKESIIKYRNGSSFISKYKFGNGTIYLCASPLDETYNSLSQNAEIFVPLLYKMSISKVASDQLAFVIAEDEVLSAYGVHEDEHNILKIKRIGGDLEFIPGQQVVGSVMLLNMNEQIRNTGFYQLNRDKEILAQWAYNFGRLESELICLSYDELYNQYKDSYQFLSNKLEANLTNIIKEKNEGFALWKWALILSLIFLMFEIILLRTRRI